MYTFGGIIPIVAIIDSGLTTPEKLLVSFIAVVGLLIFEASSQGTIFRPEIEEEAIIENIYNEVRPGSDIYAAQSATGQYITESRQRGRNCSGRSGASVKSSKLLVQIMVDQDCSH